MNAQNGNWELIRSAYLVAKLGTVSGAASQAGVHHATIIRHIDALESDLGVKLFQRHARGYVPTEAGRDLLRVAAAAGEQFDQLLSRIHGRGAAVSGDLVVTALSIFSPQITGWLGRLQALHPELTTTLIADDRPLRLEYGEAHVAIRAGGKPAEPDNVVQHLLSADNALYASADYVERFGVIRGQEDIANHRFLATTGSIRRAPYARWLTENVPPEAIVFRASNISAVADAAKAGIGIMPHSRWSVLDSPDLVEVMPPQPEWRSDFWLVTHVDLHRTAKVQACLDHFKREAKLVTQKLAD